MNKIRALRDGEPLPPGEPRRYRNRDGYIRLRWRIGVREYIEVLEHRLVVGLAVAQVHHRNRDKADNRPENLQPVTSLQHGTAHSRVNFPEAEALYRAGWSLQDLAKKYAVDRAGLWTSFHRRGIVLRPRLEAVALQRAKQCAS